MLSEAAMKRGGFSHTRAKALNSISLYTRYQAAWAHKLAASAGPARLMHETEHSFLGEEHENAASCLPSCAINFILHIMGDLVEKKQ